MRSLAGCGAVVLAIAMLSRILVLATFVFAMVLIVLMATFFLMRRRFFSAPARAASLHQGYAGQQCGDGDDRRNGELLLLGHV
ncbi:hypothetical protein CEJ42_14815 [Herbaspirillum robiniae]|uniref:Uncharacterized protein n=1 Tax=Herbaspirillum robiniae TaxID=2014887 RepID=A0A246WQ45_9BURK|nr:hypothetical protein CEJ42_14815 [Herbaspirillum robiniae]